MIKEYKTATLSFKFATARKKRALRELVTEYNKQNALAKKHFLMRKKLPRPDYLQHSDYSRYASTMGLTAKLALSCAVRACCESQANHYKVVDGYVWLPRDMYEFIENPNKSSKYTHFLLIKAMGRYGRLGTRKNLKFVIPVAIHKQFNRFENDPEFSRNKMIYVSATDVKFTFTRIIEDKKEEPKGDLAIDFDRDGQIYTANNTEYAKQAALYQARLKKALTEQNKRKIAAAKAELNKYIKSQFKKMLDAENPARIVLGDFAVKPNQTYSCGLKALELCELYCVPSKVIHLAHRNMICVQCGCKNHDNGDFFLAFFCERCGAHQNKARTGAQNLTEEHVRRQTGSKRDKYAEYVARQKAIAEDENFPQLTEEMIEEIYPEYRRQRKREQRRRIRKGLTTETPHQQYVREWMNE